MKNSSTTPKLPKSFLLIAFRLAISFTFLQVCYTDSIPNFDLTSVTLNPTKTGYTISGFANGDWLGFSTKTAGDINKDGYDDFLVGAPQWASQRGIVYVIYGGPTNSFVDIDLSTTSLDPASTGFAIMGETAGDQFGYSVSTAGDMNKDGYADIVIGANARNTNQGAAYVIFGRPTFSSNIDLSSTPLDPTSTGFMIAGITAGDQFGYSVSEAGDINKDGYGDIIISAYLRNSEQGSVYVIYGQPTYSSNFILGTTPLNPAISGFTLTGALAGDHFGSSVSGIGDINGDTYDDFAIGAEARNSWQGAVYVVYGQATPGDIDLSSGAALSPASTGFRIYGGALGDNFGFTVSKAGDVNNDGIVDILVGAWAVDSAAGAAYVIYGALTPADLDLSLAVLDPGTTGFKVSGGTAGDHLGSAVSTAGDMNGDGYSDILVGADWWNSSQGAAYVIYGRETPENIDFSSGMVLDPETTGFTIKGAGTPNNLGFGVGIAGDINSDGFPDILVGMYTKDSGRGAVNVIHAGTKILLLNDLINNLFRMYDGELCFMCP